MNIKSMDGWHFPLVASLYCGHEHDNTTYVKIALPVDATEAERDIVWQHMKKGEPVSIARPFNFPCKEWEVRMCDECCTRYRNASNSWKVVMKGVNND